MKPILCSLWDSMYLLKGLALIESVRRHQPDFQLFVLALDEETLAAVRGLKDPRIACVERATVVSPGMEQILQNRNAAERAWTLTPFWMQYLLHSLPLKSHVPHLAYVDADSFLFGALDPIYQEIGESSVAIVPHRFPPALAWRADHNGKFNVNFVYVRADEVGRMCVRKWAESCASWCYQRTEREPDGSLLFGDQGYLDDWEHLYKAHAVQHTGANLAPWSQQQYDYCFDGQLYIIEKREIPKHGPVGVKSIRPLLFYHFHGMEWRNGKMNYGGYAKILKKEVLEHIYGPYNNQLATLERSLAAAGGRARTAAAG